MTSLFDAIKPMFARPVGVGREDVAQAMEFADSVMANYGGPQVERTARQKEADRQARWARASGLAPGDVRKSGVMSMRSTPGTYDQAMMMAGLAPLNMIVYHGSPHRFARFDASKIGTGEGAQAYGHGLYFAENPSVAQFYGATGQPAFTNAGVRAIVSDVMKDAAAKGLSGKEASKWAKGEIHRLAMERPSYARQQWFDAMNNLDDIIAKPAGNLYKVDLPDEQIAKMLDWDKPLSQQPESVRKAFSELRRNVGDAEFNKMTGGAAIQTLGDSVETSQMLRQAGIPGIRYLDQGSRGAGQGTYNYVVFPGGEDMLKILSRE